MSHRGEKKPEKVTFGDVVGCDEAKDEIKQVRIGGAAIDAF